MGGGSSTSAFRAESEHPKAEHVSLVVDFHSMRIGENGNRPATPEGGVPAPYLSGYKVFFGDENPVERLYLWRRTRRERSERAHHDPDSNEVRGWYVPTDEATWPNPTIQGRVPVASIEGLAPPPPELNVGDRFPAVSLSYRYRGRDLLGLWQPGDLGPNGRLKGNGPRPTALVLPFLRTNGIDSAWLTSVANAIEDARTVFASANDDGSRPPVIAGSPVVATDAVEADLGAVQRAADTWAQHYTKHDAGQRFPSKIPDASWLPASLLLDRVAPGAEAAIVVIDRSGWITGVIGPEVTGDDLVSAIAEAVRSAAR